MTALDLIKRAYRLIGVYSIGETPSADESADALTALNSMIASWGNEKLMVYAASLDSFTLTPGQAVYTIGPSGGIVSTRPQDISTATNLVWQGVTYPLEVASLEQYQALTIKGLTTTLPQAVWLNQTYPDAELTVYPVPTIAMTLNLWSWKPLAGFAAVTDVVSLPPGYEKAIAYNLAIELAPENEVQVSAAVERGAVTSKKLIKRTNFTPVYLTPVQNTGRFNIYSGQYQ